MIQFTCRVQSQLSLLYLVSASMVLDWQDFKAVFHPKSDFKPDAKHADAVLKYREELGGVLFFDRIWSSLGLKQRESPTVESYND